MKYDTKKYQGITELDCFMLAENSRREKEGQNALGSMRIVVEKTEEPKGEELG